jgi:hypothetical protein
MPTCCILTRVSFTTRDLFMRPHTYRPKETLILCGISPPFDARRQYPRGSLKVALVAIPSNDAGPSCAAFRTADPLSGRSAGNPSFAGHEQALRVPLFPDRSLA